eukprot:362836-Chlamydomonas_euryale.AAC.17
MNSQMLCECEGVLVLDCSSAVPAVLTRAPPPLQGWSHQPVWADADKYLEEAEAEQELEEIDQMQKKAAKESNKEDAAMIPA